MGRAQQTEAYVKDRRRSERFSGHEIGAGVQGLQITSRKSVKRIRHSAIGLLVAEMGSQEGLQAHTHARSQAAPTSTSKYLCKRAKFQGIPAGTESGAPEVTALERCIRLEARQVTRSRYWLVLL